jgi:hypothetical protein
MAGDIEGSRDMTRQANSRSVADRVLRFLFPMVSFDDVFWFPLMVAAAAAAPFLLFWVLDLASTSYGFHLLSLPLAARVPALAGAAAALLPASYVSFVALYSAGFFGIVLLASAFSGSLWMCEKAASIARS